ncbi:DNA-binding transcriptional ArsR family regulator [Microbacterium sp. BE35]|uniref:ArsR/SmtB family transcription factor n=1 Tax=Microbacterium sp. BE35 TaxID=2817773 RepID=UPI002866BF1F|nr:metalloregulator ArsR/SmtB family transcription factor [Microbacterium sp. BE35]MDR7188234.1 DNA-binding transcriptional ArsR family regulator [Microbacterium sp. BE35]
MQDLEELTRVFGALANPIRLRIVATLAEARRASEATPGVMQLAAALEITRFAASFHLEQLRTAGLIRRERVGARWAHSIVDETFDVIDEWLFDVAPPRGDLQPPSAPLDVGEP